MNRFSRMLSKYRKKIVFYSINVMLLCMTAADKLIERNTAVKWPGSFTESSSLVRHVRNDLT
jgi:hypothetical protein